MNGNMQALLPKLSRWGPSEWCHKWGRFVAILAHVTWPQGPITRPKYFTEVFIGNYCRLEFKPLVNLLAFLVQMLWS